MNKVTGNAVIALAGLATSVATAFLVSWIYTTTEFHLFNLTILFIVPLGAALCGAAGASGYYLAARALQQQAGKLLLMQMLVVAALTLALIYYLEYRMISLDGVALSSVLPFGEYLRLNFTSMSLTEGGDELGSAGYLFALLDFAGLMIGSVFVYLKLKDEWV
jgi:hypothetical protein